MYDEGVLTQFTEVIVPSSNLERAGISGGYAMPAAEQRVKKRNSTISVLVVEDEAIIARDITDTLTDLGYRVVGHASNGQDALAIVERKKPDVVLMDMVLEGDMSGVEVASALSEKGVPVIYLTAYSDDETIRRAKLTRPYGYITKPYTERDLRTNIEIAHHEHKIKMEIESNRKILDSIFSTAPETLIVYDFSRDHIIMENQATFLGEENGDFLHALFSKDPRFILEEGSEISSIDDLKNMKSGEVIQSLFRRVKGDSETEWFLLRAKPFSLDDENGGTTLTISLSKQTELVKAQNAKRETESLKMRYAISKVITDLIPMLLVNSKAASLNNAFYREISSRVDDILFDSFFRENGDEENFWRSLTVMFDALGGDMSYRKEGEKVVLEVARCPWSGTKNPIQCKIMKGMMERFAAKKGASGTWNHDMSIAKGDRQCRFVVSLTSQN